MMTKPTKSQAAKALAAVKAQFAGYGEEGLTYQPAWDYPEGGPKAALVWEEGPEEWAYAAALEIVQQVPGLYAEPYNTWSVALYREA